MPRNRHITPYFIFTGLTALLLFLAGCSVIMDTGRVGEKKVYGLTESSYAAADMLIQQSKSSVSPESPLEIGVLIDLDNPNERTNFGNIVSGQIASRFVQLGYNVIVSPFSSIMEATEGEQGSLNPDSRPLSDEQQGSAITGRRSITGHYAVTPTKILVNLRIMEIDTGRLLAAYDYTLPKSRDIRELTKTKADKNSFF